MRVEHVPASAWTWRGSALVFVLVAAPQFALVGISPELRSVSVAAAVGGLVTYLAVLLTALVVYLQFRLTQDRATGWLALCLALASVQGIVLACSLMAAPHRAADLVPWTPLIDLAYGSALLVVLLVANRLPVNRDPMATGVAVGLMIGAWRVALLAGVAPRIDLSASGLAALDLSLFAIHCAIAWRVFCLPGLPRWVSWRLGLAVCLLSLSLTLSTQIGPSELGIVTLLLNPVGAVLMCSASLAWLRDSIQRSQRAIEELSDRLHSVEAGHLADRERLHEINGTIAGIASASRLIHEDPSMPQEHAAELRHMVDAEVERLERLMQERDPAPLLPVDIDEVVGLLVTAQRTLGRTIYWKPSGQVVEGRSDDVAEVLNILLNNAARHAPESPAAVTTELDGETVRILVSDWGPGVPPELRDRIFEPDERGPHSPGEGIGLAVARRLMREQHGFVELAETDDRGATFVVGLHAWKGADDPAVAR